MPLDDYEKKRDFRRTPEPAAATPAKRTGDPVFVVHRHEARALHYDLRLEVDGVLWSFAVPRGFSYDPRQKRLAVRTEDHPIEYERFSGVIPKGQYGAGTMTIWDRGTLQWVVETDPHKAVEKGELKVVLRGRKLRGEWHLVKTKQAKNSWLLFKSRDRYAGPDRETALGVDVEQARAADFPGEITPMRPGAVREPFDDPDWVFEMRFSGRRAMAEKRGDSVRLRGVEIAPEGLFDDLSRLRAEDALIDGVLIATDENGRPDPDLLDRALRGEEAAPLSYYAFDLIHFDGFDLRPLPLIDRKAALRAIQSDPKALLFVDHVAGNGRSLARAIAEASLGAMVAKRARSPYREGAHEDWVCVPVDGAAVEGDERAPARPAGASRVRFTNLAKVYWPAEGYTKGDLIAYYERVAEYLLPYLKDRPVHMNRYPDGIDGKAFYQRHANETTPAWMQTVRIRSDSKDDDQPYIVCNDRDTLLGLINLGSIDLHPWMSRHQDVEHPDYAVLDLDPKGAPFRDVVRIARVAGRVMRGIGLKPYLKTSGKTGLHLVIGLEPIYTYEHVRMFLEGVARVIARELRDIATVERVVGHREGKVYLDYLQNGKGQTVVPAYVARPVRGATVSAPLDWDELDPDLDPSRFTIQTMPDRLERVGDLFAGVLEQKSDLIGAAGKLAEMVRDQAV